MKKILGLILSIFLLLHVSSCSTFGSHPEATSQPKTLEELVSNQGSMTKALEGLHHQLSVTIIKDGIVTNEYYRISSLKLDNQPVIVAVVSTNVANSTFVDILRHANTTPIGKKLFAKDSGISRQNMKVDVLTVKDVKNAIAHGYLNKIGYSDDAHLVMRNSTFTHDKETLTVIEYILPSMTKYFSK